MRARRVGRGVVVAERDNGVGRGRPLSRAFAGAMNRILGAAEARNDAGAQLPGGSAVVDCGVYVDGKRQPGDYTPDAALRAAGEHDNAFVWLGLHEPSETEMSAIARS